MAILETRDNLGEEERYKALESLLEEFNLTHIRSSLGMSLSGGERRRVEIARSLVLDPSFLLLDEPFAGIDPIAVIELQGIINQLKERGMGILITDHNVRETLSICDHAYILSKGVILESGDPDTIAQSEKAKEVYLGEGFSLR